MSETNLSELFRFASDAILLEKPDQILSSSLEMFVLRFLVPRRHDLNIKCKK